MPNLIFKESDGSTPRSIHLSRIYISAVSVNHSRDFQRGKVSFLSSSTPLLTYSDSGAIAFTVRTYFIPITEMCQEPHIPGRLASAIRSWPDDVSLYKGKASYNNVLLPYLDKVHQEQKDSGLIDCDEGQFNYPY